MDNKALYKTITKEEVFPALWCTEPIAIAYAVSKAKNFSSWEIEKIIIGIDKDTYKNAKWVIIPNSWNNMWIKMAVSLWIYWSPEKEMQVLDWLTQEEINKAIEFSKKWIIDERLLDTTSMKIFSEIISTKSNVKVTIEWWHKNITSIIRNWEEILEKKDKEKNISNSFSYQYELMNKDLKAMIEIAQSIDEEDIEYLKKWIKMQFDIWEYLKENFIEEFEILKNSYSNSIYSKELQEILIKSTSATYARMSWINKPVMSSWWSGNQWIVAMLVPYLYWTIILWKENDDRDIYESIALSNILNAYVKCYTGAVSSMCWCWVAAWEWAVAAMLYQKWEIDKIWLWIDNMLAWVWWMLCDWAKVWCYNKVASSVLTSINAVNQASTSLWVSESDWIIWRDSLESIRNMSEIANNEKTNELILSIIKNK